MIAVIENSSAILYRATHILHLRIQSAQATGWVSAPTGGVTRSVELELNLVAVFKGRTRQKAGENLQVTITQYGTGMSRKFAVPGIWSPVPTEVDGELITFSRFPGPAAADTGSLLSEPSCEMVMPAGEALADVQLALQIENANPAPAKLFSLIGPQAAGVHNLFSDYLWARVHEQAFANLEVFDRLLKFLEEPTLSPIARSMLLDLIYTGLYGLANASEKHTCHFAAALFRLVELPEAALLHDNILGVFLPNLLGIRGGAERCHPDDIFTDDPQIRARSTQKLSNYTGGMDIKALQEWLT